MNSFRAGQREFSFENFDEFSKNLNDNIKKMADDI